MSGVGVNTWVGKVVKVGVGGNHTIVGVGEGVRVPVAVGVRETAGASGAGAASVTQETRQKSTGKKERVFILEPLRGA
jgi:hypothetical protein